MTDLHQLWFALDARLSALLQNLPWMPQADRDAIRDYIDHNEFGLALELLINTVADLGQSLPDDQHLEVAELAGLMGMPASVLQPLKPSK